MHRPRLLPLLLGAVLGVTTARAERVPLVVYKEADLLFGDIIAGGQEGGVVLAPTGERMPLGGVALGMSGPVSAGRLAVTGEAGATFAILLPAGPVVLTSPQGATLQLDTFTSTPSSTAALGGTGQTLVHVGATLHVGALQAPGDYGGTFEVHVAYN